MPCWRFLKIMKYLRCDLKTERRKNLEEDKFCWAFLLWNPFLENCQKACNPNVNITIDEELLPCRARCKVIKYMPNKPDKFGIKFWMAVDAESKHLYNGFPYLGKDLTRSGDASLPTDMLIKLMGPLFRQGFNVTCDNYFTSLNLLLRLAKRQCSLVGTIRTNGRKIPDLLKKKRMLHDTMTVYFTGDTTATITSYQCKYLKSVNILSTLDKKVVFQSTIIRSVSINRALL